MAGVYVPEDARVECAWEQIATELLRRLVHAEAEAARARVRASEAEMELENFKRGHR